MDESEYARICSLATYPLRDDALTSRRGHADAARDAPLSVSEETFAVIKRQAEHRRLRAELRLHRQDKMLRQYLARLGDLNAPLGAVEDGGAGSGADRKQKKSKAKAARESLCGIAAAADFSPCMLARVLLEAKYGWSKTTIANVFKEALAAADSAEANARGLGAREYAQVLREVKECIDRDALCSPLADRIRHNLGVEYEYVLLETLRNRRLVFESEDVLREKGLAKTPDVRLLLPVGVRDPRTGELRVVHWIDSKAMFGDRHTHESENAGQLQGYVNRFGPGMVIYWFGHVADLSSDRDVFITHEFPREIELPGGLDPSTLTLGRDDPPLDEGVELALEPLDVATAFDSDWTPVSTVSVD
ncbi:hypothetical protein PybrP1_005957 [[Pythium] brassicae (nom. inval.)]|nr:hypothetical protein PybrP1_005957 [[Pythium] brassicae (nom. inval.)]